MLKRQADSKTVQEIWSLKGCKTFITCNKDFYPEKMWHGLHKNVKQQLFSTLILLRNITVLWLVSKSVVTVWCFVVARRLVLLNF